MKPRLRKKPMAEINVVPYIDVMLVLLIIFMITAPLLSQGVKIELPRIASEPLPPDTKEPAIVTIDQAGNYFINFGDNQDQPISAQVLVNRIGALLQYRENLPVLVKGDTNVPYGRVVEVMGLLQRAGVDGVGLVTKPPPPQP